MSAAPKLGVKMGPEDAKSYVDAVNGKIASAGRNGLLTPR